MKKFYAMIMAALMSVSVFADPTQADLAGYLKAGYYVACFKAPEGATCNDIAWVGTYNAWNLQDPDILFCQELAGFSGWYVVVVPAGAYPNNDTSKEFDPEGECSGKPVQKNECGLLNWEYQNGGTGTCALVAGSVTIDEKGAETDLKDWSKTEATIITISAWKNDKNPCEATCAQFDLTIRVYDPFCESNPLLAPTVKGSWDWDAAATKMDLKGSYYEAVVKVDADVKFKFNNDVNGSWDNQFEYFIPEDEDNDIPAKWVAFDNFSLASASEDYCTYDATNKIITFDFSDPTKFRYASCGIDDNDYEVTVNLKTTSDAPEEGIEMAGSFASDDWTVFQPMELKSDGSYSATLTTKGSKEFKFRQKDSWDNEIVYVNQVDNEGHAVSLKNIKFGEAWQDAGEGKKVINLDYSDAAVYVWKANWVAPQGIEDIVLTEKAQKVMVDGVLYIIRDNKMFNVQGAQVR